MRQLLVGDTAPGQTQHRQHCMLLEQGYYMHCSDGEPKVYRQHPPPRTTVSAMGLLSCFWGRRGTPVLARSRQGGSIVVDLRSTTAGLLVKSPQARHVRKGLELTTSHGRVGLRALRTPARLAGTATASLWRCGCGRSLCAPESRLWAEQVAKKG